MCIYIYIYMYVYIGTAAPPPRWTTAATTAAGTHRLPNGVRTNVFVCRSAAIYHNYDIIMA